MITLRGKRSPGRVGGAQHGARSSALGAGREPVARPLPDVAAHVVEPVAVRGEAADGRRALEAVLLQVLPGELALPGVRHRRAAGRVLVAPGERRSVEAAARGELPLGLGREFLPRPRRVCLGVLVGDLHDRVPVAAVDRAARPGGSLPGRAGDVLPPAPDVVERHRPVRPAEHERAGHEQLGVGVRVVGGVERPLRDGDVAGLADEAPVLGGRDLPRVHQEPGHRDPAHGPLLGIEVLRAHRERAAGNRDHGRPALLGGRRTTHRAIIHRSRVTFPHPAWVSNRFTHPGWRRVTRTGGRLVSPGSRRSCRRGERFAMSRDREVPRRSAPPVPPVQGGTWRSASPWSACAERSSARAC